MSKAEQILRGLGGDANVLDLEACITRLRVEVEDPALVDDATLTAACSAVPDDPPARMPSSRASRRAIANDSASVTRTHVSTRLGSKVSGKKSSPMPSTCQEPGASPDSIEPAGSAPTTSTDGLRSLR